MASTYPRSSFSVIGLMLVVWDLPGSMFRAVARTIARTAYRLIDVFVDLRPAAIGHVVAQAFGAAKVQACAYVMCLAKRERPNNRHQWRMCPSV